MIPIHKLLSRIRWDREFGQGDFLVGYYDRVLEKIIHVSFAEIIFPEYDRNSVLVMDPEGVVHSVPLHRIREVVKDGQLIWHRG